MTAPILVSSRTQREVDQDYTSRQTEAAARILAANILRIMRGAGKPHLLMEDISRFVQTAREFFDAHGFWPTQELSSYLSYQDRERDYSQFDDAARMRAYAVDDMIAGSLQIAASRLLGQRTHISAGETQLSRGAADWEEGWELERARFRSERARKSGQAKKKRKVP